ncbi:AAA family ATPase [Meiothermus sp. CFH 77666]|uniref:ATP-binding protein n=1 Tax=Meiothermus sp. CFH 77666 TaxID=2817942 RepID=UPI001AA01990|nr:AAA family ATPase [Meiothermus sp. CFH 77666]MBO1437545.1 AAA family ATPase [Meiothermus sp. CFH 77666]
MPETLPQPSELVLHLLGSPRVWLGGQGITLPTKKLLGLVAYLALEGPTPRSKLAGLFWSENDEESARRNLRRELFRLRETPLKDCVQVGSNEVGVASPAQTDVARFRALVEQGRYEEALNLYRGALLEALELPGADGFSEWLAQEREELGRLWQRTLLYQAENLETRGDWRGALEIHLQLLAQDSLQERHQREVMRLYYLLGEREAALERFEQFRGTLRQELGLEPLPETLHLAEQIRSARSVETRPLAVQPAGSVLPLTAPLVGREQVWQQMESAWADGQWVLLGGLAGVGKTRLLREFMLHQGRPLLHQGRPTDACLPFATLSRAIREQWQTQPNPGLAPWVRLELARLVPELEDAPPPPLRAPDERLRLYEAYVVFLESALRETGGLVFDDLQYFDLQSLELLMFALQRLHERGQAYRFLGAYRRGELGPEAERLLRQLHALGPGLELELKPLSAPQMLELVRRMSGSPEGQIFTQRLYRATAGNPFFLLETLKTLFESGLLRINQEGGWETPFDQETSDYRELPIPKSVREAVLRRVENLGEGARRLLEAACLATDGFSLATLGGATALSEWEAVEALEQTLEAAILESSPHGYRFAHDLFAESLREALSPERKRLLHRKLAASLERLDGPAAQIAEHLERAQEPQEVIRWRIRAAQTAERVYAHPEALAQYQRALELGLRLPEAFGVHLALANLYQNQLDYARAQQELERLDGTARSSSEQAELDVAWARLLFHQGRYEQARSKAQAALERAPDGPSRVLALRLSGSSLFRLGDSAGAIRHLEQGLEAARQYAFELIPTLSIDLAYPLLQQGQTEQARQQVEQALRLTQPWQRDHALALNARARLELATNQTEQAGQTLGQALEVAYRLQDETLAFAFLTNLLRVQLEAGALPEARDHLLEAETRFKNAHPRTQSTLKRRLAEVEYLSGHLGAALRALQAAIAMADALGERDQQVSLRALQATWLGYLGALPQGWEVCAALKQLQPESPQLRTTQALLYLLEGRLSAAQALLEPLQAEPPSLPEAQATVSCYLGLLANRQKEPEKALALAQTRYPSGALQALNLAVRLEATRQLGQPLEPLLLEAQALLASGKAPPLEGLELRRVLLETLPNSPLRRETQQSVQALAATLEGYLELKQTFLQRQRDGLR